MVYFIQTSSSFSFALSSFSKNITCFIFFTLMLSLLSSSTSAQYVCDHSTSSLIISMPPSAPVQTLPISVIDIDNCETVVISGITTQSYIYFTSSSGTISNVTNLTLSNIRCIGNSNGIANCISFRSVLYNISTISFSNIQLDSSFDTNDFAISPATSTSASSFAKTVINFEKSVNLVDDGIYFENIKMGKAFCRKSVFGASCAVNNVRFNQAMKKITLIEATSLHITNVDFDFGQGMGQVVNFDIYLASSSAGSVGNTDGTDNIEVKRIIFNDFRISSAVGVKSQTHVGASLTVSNLRFGRVAQNIFAKEFSNVGPATMDRAWMIDSIASARSLLRLTNFVISDVSSNILSPSEASGLSNFIFETPMQWIGWVQVYLDSFTVESIQCQVGISNNDQQQQLLPAGSNVGNGGNSTFQVLNFFVNSSAIILLSSLSVFSEVTITNFLVQNVDVQMNYLGGSGVDLEIASIFMVRPICRYHKYLFENVTLLNLVVNSPSVCREEINVAAIRLSSYLWAYQGTVISSPFVGDATEAYVVILGDEDVVASVIFKNIIVNKISLDLCLLESTNALTSYSRPLNVIAAHNLRSFDHVVFENVSLTNVEKLSNNGSASLKVNVVSLEAYISTSVAGAPARSAHETISLLSFNNLQMINISNVLTEQSASEIQFYITIINEAIGRFQNVRFTNFIFQNFKKTSCLQNVVSVTSISLRTEVVQGLSTTGIDPTNSSAVVTTATSEFLISNITTRNLEIFANHSSEGSLGGSSEITTVIMFGLNSFRSVIFENIVIDDCLLVSGVTEDAAKLLGIISTPTMLEAAKGWSIASFSTYSPLEAGGNNNTLNSIFSVTNVTISNINNNNLDQNSFYFFPSSSSSLTAKTKIPEFYLHHEVDCIELGSQLTGFRTVVFDQISAIGLGGGRCYSSVLLRFDNSIESLPSSSYSFGPSSLLRISNLLFSPLLISQNNNNNFRFDPSNDFVKVATNVRPISSHFGVQFGGLVTNYGSVAICNITFQNVVSILTSLDASAIYRLVYAERLSSAISVVTFQGPSPLSSIVTPIPSPVSSFLVENLTMCDVFVKAAITVASSASAAGLQIFGVLLIAEIKNFYLVKFSNIYHTSRNFLVFSVEATNFLLELKGVALSEPVYCESATVNNNNNNDEGCSFVVKHLGFVGPMTLRSDSGLYAKNLQINQHLSGFRQILIDNLTIDDVYAKSLNSGTSEIANFVSKDQTYFISSFIDMIPAFTPPPLTPAATTTTMSAPEIPTALSPPSLVSITNLHQRNVTSIHGGTKLVVGNLIIHGTIAEFENILFENFTINSTSSRVFTSSTSICNNIGGRISATNLDNCMLRVGNIQFGVGNIFGSSQIVGLSDGTNLNSSFIVRNVYFDFSGASSESCSSSSPSSISLSHQIFWGSRDPDADAVSLSAVRFMYPITQFNTFEFRSIGFLGCKKCFLNASQVSLSALYLTEVQSIITEYFPLPPPSSAQQRAFFLEKPPSFICENIQIINMKTEYISSIALAQFGTSILNFAKVSFINLDISDCTFVSPPPQSFIMVVGVWTKVAVQGISDGEDDTSTTAKASSILSFEHIKFSSLNVIADSPVDVYAICTSSPISNFTNIFMNDIVFDHIKIESAQRVDGHIALAKLVGPISGVVPAANSKILFNTPSSNSSSNFVVQNLHMIDVTSTIHSTTITHVDASGKIKDFSKMEISNFSATRILVNFAGKVPSSVTDIVPQFKIYFAHFAADVTMLTLNHNNNNNNNNNSVVITNLTFQDIHFEANNYVVVSSPVSFILRCVALEQSVYNVDRFSLTNVAMDNIFLIYPPDLGVTQMKMDIVVGVALSDYIPSTISSSASRQSLFEMSNLQLTNFFIDSPDHFHSWPSATSSPSSTQLFEGKLTTTVFSSQNVNPSTAGIVEYQKIKFSNMFVQTPQRLNSINNNKNARLLLNLNDPNIVPLYFAGSSLEGRQSSSEEISNFRLEIDNVTISDDNITRVNTLGETKDSSIISANQQQQQGKSPNLVASKQGMIAAVSIDFNSGYYVNGFETASFSNIHLLVKTVIVVPSQFVRITSFLLQFKMGDDVRIWNFVNNSFDFRLLPLNYETYFFVGNQSTADLVPQLPTSPIPSKYYSFGYGRISFLLIPPQKYFSSSTPQYNFNVSVTFESNTFHFSNSLSSTSSSSSSSLFPSFIISQQQRVNNDLKFGEFVGIFIFFIDVFEQLQITNQNSLLNGAWKFTRNVFDTNDVCYKKSAVASNPYFFKFTSAAVQPPIHVTSAFLGLALVTFTFPSSLTFTDNLINFESSPYSQLLLFISAASYPPSVKFLQQTNNNYGSIFSKTTNFTFDCNRWKDAYLKTFMQNFVAPATTVALKNISLSITTIFNVFQFNFTVGLLNNKNFRKNCSLLSTSKSNSKSKYFPSESMSLSKPSPSLITKSASTNDLTKSNKMTQSDLTATKSLPCTKGTKSGDSESKTQTASHPPPRPPLLQYSVKESSQTVGVVISTIIPSNAGAMNIRRIMSIAKMIDCGGKANEEGGDDNDDEGIGPDVNPLMLKIPKINPLKRGTIVGALLVILIWCSFFAVIAVIKKWFLSSDEKEKRKNIHLSRPRSLIASYGRAFRKMGLPGQAFVPASSLLPASVATASTIAATFAKIHKNDSGSGEKAIDGILIFVSYLTSIVLPLLVMFWIHRQIQSHEVLLTKEILKEDMEQDLEKRNEMKRQRRENEQNKIKGGNESFSVQNVLNVMKRSLSPSFEQREEHFCFNADDDDDDEHASELQQSFLMQTHHNENGHMELSSERKNNTRMQARLARTINIIPKSAHEHFDAVLQEGHQEEFHERQSKKRETANITSSSTSPKQVSISRIDNVNHHHQTTISSSASSNSLWETILKYFCNPRMEYRRSKFSEQYGAIFTNVNNFRYTICAYANLVAIQATSGVTDSCTSQSCCKSGLIAMLIFTITDLVLIVAFRFPFLVRIEFICVVISCAISFLISCLSIHLYFSTQITAAAGNNASSGTVFAVLEILVQISFYCALSGVVISLLAEVAFALSEVKMGQKMLNAFGGGVAFELDDEGDDERQNREVKVAKPKKEIKIIKRNNKNSKKNDQTPHQEEKIEAEENLLALKPSKKVKKEKKNHKK